MHHQFKSPAGAAAGQNLVELFPDAFNTDVSDIRSFAFDGILCRRFQVEMKVGCKPHRPEQPQIILTEPFSRIADSSDNFIVDIKTAVDIINNISGIRIH